MGGLKNVERSGGEEKSGKTKKKTNAEKEREKKGVGEGGEAALYVPYYRGGTIREAIDNYWIEERRLQISSIFFPEMYIKHLTKSPHQASS